MGRKRKKSNKTHYFTNDVDIAIVEFNSSEDENRKNHLYKSTIFPALDKLSENVINTWKFPYIDLPYEDLKHEVVVFLTEKLDRFSQESGKAFSYFTIVGRHYLIARNKKSYEKTKSRTELATVDEERNIPVELSISGFRDSLSCFIDEWVEEVDDKLEEYFPDHESRAVADSILELFRDRKVLDSFNKKALYVLIRERVGTKTQKITKVLNFLKQDFYRGFNEYLK